MGVDFLKKKLLLIIPLIVLTLAQLFTIKNGYNYYVKRYLSYPTSGIEKRYTQISGYYKSDPLYFYKDIAVNSEEYIFIASDTNISIFDKEGNAAGEFIFDFSNFRFKIDDEDVLWIVSDNSKLTGAEEKANVYEIAYNMEVVSAYHELYRDSDWRRHIEIDKFVLYKGTSNQNFDEYCEQNGYDMNNEVTASGKKYEYISYGKLLVSGESGSNTIELQSSTQPIPMRVVYIFDAILLIICLIPLLYYLIRYIIKPKKK